MSYTNRESWLLGVGTIVLACIFLATSVGAFLGVVSIQSTSPGIILPAGWDRWAGGVVLAAVGIIWIRRGTRILRERPGRRKRRRESDELSRPLHDSCTHWTAGRTRRCDRGEPGEGGHLL